jgi:hypothetical protein
MVKLAIEHAQCGSQCIHKAEDVSLTTCRSPRGDFTMEVSGSTREQVQIHNKRINIKVIVGCSRAWIRVRWCYALVPMSTSRHPIYLA